MARLPQPGADDGTWGDILNTYLKVSHDDNGVILDGIITEAKLSSAVQTKLNDNSSSGVSSVNTRTGAVTLTKTDVGLSNVDNTSDANKPVSSTTQTALNAKADISSLAPVATSGSYTDLTSKPAIPVAGTTSGTYAAGNDSRITGALQASNNLSDVASATTARTNLGLSTVASTGSYTDLTNKPTIPSVSDATTGAKGIVQLAGDLSGTAAAPTLASTTNVNNIISANTTVAGAAQKANNLSDLASAPTARTNLGLGNVDNTSDVNKPVSTATQTALSGKEPTVTAGSTTQYYRGDKTWQTLDKTAVGLANVDNTSDVNKPISTATQTALAAKADASSVGAKVLLIDNAAALPAGTPAGVVVVVKS